jgi:hypothetical protein
VKIRNLLLGTLLSTGLLASLYFLRAQGTATIQNGTASVNGANVDWSSASDLEVMLQAVEGTTPVPASQLPASGNFYSAQHPTDWPPLPGNMLGLPAWPLGDGFFLLNDTNVNYGQLAQSQTTARSKTPSGIRAMNEGSTGGGFTPAFNFPVNSLWLQITGVTNGLANLILNNATDQVYEVLSKTNLMATNWNIEPSEVWPTNSAAMPFTVPVFDRTNTLFIWARDWTGVRENGNTTPDWWFWEYFGTLALSDTNLDSQGNTLLSDYNYGLDPNVISFSISVTNQYVNFFGAPLQLNVTAGAPAYFAVLVDSTNFAGAAWVPYTSPYITVNLGPIEGWHDVWVGLRGLPPNATQTWQWKHLNLTLPPVLVITNPAAFVVNEPVIQIYGYCRDVLAGISYDISNAVGVVTNQPSEITDQDYDTNACGFTTNYFECLDVPLNNGLNTITIHATDWAGDTTITNFNFTLDYSSKTNPPVALITWPTNGTQISGSNFTCRGWISDPTAAVTTQLILTNSNTNFFFNGIYTNTYSAGVERNGNFWLENLPLNTGTNTFTIKVVDAVGNTTVSNISVVKSALVLTINPVTPESQLWQPTVNLTGTISDPTYAIWVNGVKGHNNGNDTWSANNVPVNNGGTASFTATAYAPNEQQPDGSYGN